VAVRSHNLVPLLERGVRGPRLRRGRVTRGDSLLRIESREALPPPCQLAGKPSAAVVRRLQSQSRLPLRRARSSGGAPGLRVPPPSRPGRVRASRRPTLFERRGKPASSRHHAVAGRQETGGGKAVRSRVSTRKPPESRRRCRRRRESDQYGPRNPIDGRTDAPRSTERV
jgi:hypothetical protein